MRACWVLMMLLSCRLFHTTKFQDACKDQIQIVCVPAGDNVSVPCPKLTGQHVTFDLYQDDEVIYNQMYIRDKQAPTCKPRYTRAGVEVRENTDNESFSFTLTGVNANSYGIYRCEGTDMFPPPFRRSTLWMLMLVEGHQCNFNNVSITPKASGDQKDGFLWIWILGLVFLCIYSVIITIIASIIWVNWRRSDSQSDYMNTKPKAHKNRKKNRGVQIPIPRHF
ncbi:T-cell-specific surface glycoprotein CD28 [Anarrhichthys ocellatus]|uniref:T-cell-specific surface glycoprotein CD28 n=1 Tax=Anarrhichthys ocellatus TaxID=433405 RepID=UPI0012ED08C8|nr:T-cell-specific surface glycoprotein CD28-like [Anarrhichthys ocellatus]